MGLRVLQAIAESREPGGADAVMALEAELLSAAGHVVEPFRYPAVTSQPGVAQAIEMVWNRDAERKIGELIDSFRPDIVHVHAPYPRLSPAVFRTAARRGAATVTTMHNYRPSCPIGTFRRDGVECQDCIGVATKFPVVKHSCYHGSRAASLAIATSIALHTAVGTFSRDVHRYLALTGFGRELFVRDGLPAERIGVLDNVVADPGEPPNRGPVPERPTAIFLGRFVPEKGIGTLLNAWENLPEARLIIAGDGPLKHLVEDSVARHDNIDYVGWLGAEAQAKLFREADFLVFPSEWYEGQSLIILQAHAHGIPTVCTELKSIYQTAMASEIGTSFRTGSAEALAAAVRRLIADPHGMRARGRAAREHYLARHTPARGLGALVAEYEIALETAGKRKAA